MNLTPYIFVSVFAVIMLYCENFFFNFQKRSFGYPVTLLKENNPNSYVNKHLHAMLYCSYLTIQLLMLTINKSLPKKQSVSQAFTIPNSHFPTNSPTLMSCYSMLINLFWKIFAVGNTVFSGKIYMRNQKWNLH